MGDGEQGLLFQDIGNGRGCFIYPPGQLDLDPGDCPGETENAFMREFLEIEESAPAPARARANTNPNP